MTLKQWLLTIEKLRALSVSFFHLFTFVSSRLHVAVSHGKHRCSRLHQKLAHLHIVAGGSAVKRCPNVKIQEVKESEQEQKLFLRFTKQTLQTNETFKLTIHHCQQRLH